MTSHTGWIGVDLDGTLAHYDGWKGETHIGAPVPAMLDRVKRWLGEGRDVRIFTARVGTRETDELAAVTKAIDEWAVEHVGVALPITNVKDYGMIELWDDRAVQVEANTGRPLGHSTRGLDVVTTAPATRQIPARMARVVQLETQTCGRRGELGPWEHKDGLDHWLRGRWAATQEEADAEVAEFMAANPRGSIGHVLWSYGGEQPRTCSFCGGVHPEDAIALVEAGWEVDGTTKAYKRYMEPPGYGDFMRRIRETGYNIERAGEPRVEYPVPPVKLYTQHFTDDQILRFNAALNKRSDS